METHLKVGSGGEQRYYTALGRACDWIFRCKDCQRLVTAETLRRLGSCPCGNKRVLEVTTLSTWEWLKIRVGILRFPHRADFLREFPFTEMLRLLVRAQ